MKKKIYCAIICLLTVLSVTSCGGWKSYMENDLTKYVTVPDYLGVAYVPLSTEISDSDVDTKINEVLEANKTEKPVTDRAVKKGDIASLIYDCTVNGEACAALTVDSEVKVTVGSGTKFITGIDDFSTGLVDAAIGDKVYLTVTLPAAYTNTALAEPASLAGAEVVFGVTVKSLAESVTPDLDDEFVQTVIKSFDTVEEYRNAVRNALTEETKAKAESKKQADVWTAIVEGSVVIKYPSDSALEPYRSEMRDYYEYYANYYGLSLEEYLSQAYNMTLQQYETEELTYAQNSVKEDMVLYTIIKAENVTLSDEEYRAGLDEYYAADSGAYSSVDEFEKNWTRELIEKSLLWDKVIVLVCEAAIAS